MCRMGGHMRVVLHLEHVRYFSLHRYILFEQLVPSDICATLIDKIYEFRRGFRSHKAVWNTILHKVEPIEPSISTMIRKFRLQNFAEELTHRKPLHLIDTVFITSWNELPDPQSDCYLLIWLDGSMRGSGIYYGSYIPQEFLTTLPFSLGILFTFSSESLM